MPSRPKIQYFLSGHSVPIQAGSPAWNLPFPVSRKNDPKSKGNDPLTDLSYGDYFSAVHAFLEKDRFLILTQSAAEYLNRSIVPADIHSIHIHLEKHGAFYHPCRIEVNLDSGRLDLVLNVALSEVGQCTLEREFNLIRRLNGKYPWRYIPQVYGMEVVDIGHQTITFPMFLGEWFDGFCEFHTTSGHFGRKRIVVWDTRKGEIEVSEKLVSRIYEKTAEILTCYYDPGTFEQIHPWSHAAGDFIVRLNRDDVDMRLISVRNYGPIVNPGERDARSVLEALLVFLLNLSIRTRLDRWDGIGDLVWAEDHAISATLKGFFSGLGQIKTPDLFSESLIRFFKPYLQARSENDLMEICSALLHRYPPDAPEARIIHHNLNQHVSGFHRSVQQALSEPLDSDQ